MASQEFDVVVVGGGIAGAIAAIASARCGARTLLIEQYGFLGGMLTAAGVGPMMTFHSGATQVVQGIPGELIDRLKKRGKSPGHIEDTTGYTYTVTPFDAEGMKYELDLMFTEAGGQLLYHTMLAEANVADGKLRSIKVVNKAGMTEIAGKVFVDASGDADLSAWAGVEFNKGRETDGATQPMTMNLKMRGVDIDRVKAYIRTHPEEFPRLPTEEDRERVLRAERLSIGGFVSAMKEAMDSGELSGVRDDLLFFETNNPGEVIVNTSRILGYDSTDPWSLSQAEVVGRRHVQELEAFLKRKIVGFEQAIVVSSGPSVGVRSSRQIKGLYTLTLDDLLECRTFDDVIAHGGYPIDIHPPKGEQEEHFKQRNKEIKHLKGGETYSIPYRCLINDKVRNLVTVGRCISTTFEAQGGIRVTPIAGAIGHGGGVAAALAALGDKPTDEISIPELHSVLKKQGAYLDI
ncbi:FAD dependent oxidoreductase [Paenibacillus sp. UNCCL117]|uniref:FAD-dependent oxidoreductase n=1 Tax=unclassified Paenibacillus TaxID=185978 RepID=UPI00088092CE|nr:MULTISPECIES: FAD-dependent oxidoreductase [unclassified Paenibacillus]SDE25577.1 FAD dependent oxidoreductase [Paenibacillus sp. cl123]SFW62448.1 FAD dependent oxidoreductase [Paenibacillus sp. UNCCL117]